MRLPEPHPALLAAAQDGDRAAANAVLGLVQPALFNLAVRMLGHREDAAEATQEILLRLATALPQLREAEAFGAFAFRLARNHLLTARTRRPEAPAISFADYQARLDAGLRVSAARPEEAALTPEDKAAAREVAVRCIQGMLMCLDRDHRLAYLLDVVFGLGSEAAAAVQEVSREAHRQRLSRAKERLAAFTGSACGLANAEAACRCAWQLPASRAQAARTPPPLALTTEERAEAERRLDRAGALLSAAALLRAQPEYQAPAAMAGAVRALLAQVEI